MRNNNPAGLTFPWVRNLRIVDMRGPRRTIAVDSKTRTITADPDITLGELLEAIEAGQARTALEDEEWRS